MNACQPSNINPQESGNSYEQVEEEIVSFMLNTIMIDHIGEPEYTNMTGEPWLVNPSYPNLIVWGQTKNNKRLSINLDDPLKTWWYFNNKLIQVDDESLGVRKFVEKYDFYWDGDYYGFSILSISDDLQQAELYFEFIRRPAWGSGRLITLSRDNPSGEWRITKMNEVWVI